MSFSYLSVHLVAYLIQLTDHSSLIACAIYHPPSSNASYLENLCQQLENIKTKYPSFALWIAGDAILPDINWSSNSTSVSGYSYPLSLNQSSGFLP